MVILLISKLDVISCAALILNSAYFLIIFLMLCILPKVLLYKMAQKKGNLATVSQKDATMFLLTTSANADWLIACQNSFKSDSTINF